MDALSTLSKHDQLEELARQLEITHLEDFEYCPTVGGSCSRPDESHATIVDKGKGHEVPPPTLPGPSRLADALGRVHIYPSSAGIPSPDHFTTHSYRAQAPLSRQFPPPWETQTPAPPPLATPPHAHYQSLGDPTQALPTHEVIAPVNPQPYPSLQLSNFRTTGS